MAQYGNNEVVATNPATQLRAAIALDAAAFLDLPLPESIAAGRSCRCVVRGISVCSKENVGWELWFFRRRRTVPGEEDLDGNNIAFLGNYTFTAANGIRLTAGGNFYYYVDDLEIPYYVDDVLPDGTPDDDGQRRRLHLAVVARTLAKSANDPGSVKIQFTLEPTMGW